MPVARRLSSLVPAVLSTILIPVSIGLIFWWVPDDVDQGFSQRIFYFHVPVALTTYACFAYGALGAASTMVARRAASGIWRIATGEKPPAKR